MVDNDAVTVYQWIAIALSGMLAAISIISALSSKNRLNLLPLLWVKQGN